ncbi:MAG: hypothetical protein IGS03_15640 [Candidatus Sericytochromatia bacterium]|nr:hypothetical protein [Candidatus Sericytochromatia bacterium]
MTHVSQNPAMNQFISSNFADAASDGRITGREARELGRFIDNMQGLSEEDKGALKEMVGELEDATNGRFLFFSWKKEISPGDMQGLQNMAQSNQLAGRLLEAFQNSAPAQNQQAAPAAARDDSQVQQGGYQQAGFDPVAGQQSGGNFFERLFGGGRARATQGANGVAQAQGGVAPPWGVCQNGTGLASAGGDCGPASAAMVLKAMGVLPEDMSSADAIQAVRRAGGATQTQAPYAMSEAQINRAIETLSGGRIQPTGNMTDLVRSNAPGAYNKIAGSIQESLAAGNMTMLLTGSPTSDSRHYMMISHINENGNFVMVDPAGRGGQARVWEMTPARLQQLMREADARGGSRVMSYAQQ